MTPTLTRDAPSLCGAMPCSAIAAQQQAGVTALFRFTASVCGDSGKAHVKFGGRHEVIAAADHRPFRNAGSDMNGGKVVYAVQRAAAP